MLDPNDRPDRARGEGTTPSSCVDNYCLFYEYSIFFLNTLLASSALRVNLDLHPSASFQAFRAKNRLAVLGFTASLLLQ